MICLNIIALSRLEGNGCFGGRGFNLIKIVVSLITVTVNERIFLDVCGTIVLCEIDSKVVISGSSEGVIA